VLARFVLTKLDIAGVEVGIMFVDNKKISRFNNEYFNQDCSTDVIAFPMDGGPAAEGAPVLFGDIVVSAEKALEYARKHNIGPYEELSLYVIHGLLHLAGYDDIDICERKKMLSKQRRLLGLAGRAGLLVCPKK
jgi:probable rRNA maturation factor